MWSTPEPESVEVTETLTGELVYQPALHAEPLQLALELGAVRSIDQEYVEGALAFPAASVPKITNVCGPCRRPVYVTGEVQAVVAPPFRRHVKVAGSFAEKANGPVVELT